MLPCSEPIVIFPSPSLWHLTTLLNSSLGAIKLGPIGPALLRQSSTLLSVGVISVAVVADLYSVESSAYISTLDLLKASSMSLVKMEKSNGPNQLPWGIPDSIWIIFDRLPLKNTLCVLLDR